MRSRQGEVLLRMAPLAAAVLWCAASRCLPERLDLCGFHWLTGRPCPLCGMTHALTALGMGRWSDAVSFHALSPMAAALLLAGPLLAFTPSLERRAWQFAVVAFAVFGVLRAVRGA